MSPDPAGEFADPYSYVGGDVSNRVDPDGLFSSSNFWKGVRSTAVSLATGSSLAGLAWGRGEDFSESQGYQADDWRYYGYALGAYETTVLSAAASFYVGTATGCATCAVAAGSTISSLGFYGLTNGKSGISTNVGVGTIQWTGTDRYDWNNPFDDDPWDKNLEDALGWAGVAVDAYGIWGSLSSPVNDMPSNDQLAGGGEKMQVNTPDGTFNKASKASDVEEALKKAQKGSDQWKKLRGLLKVIERETIKGRNLFRIFPLLILPIFMDPSFNPHADDPPTYAQVPTTSPSGLAKTGAPSLGGAAPTSKRAVRKPRSRSCCVDIPY